MVSQNVGFQWPIETAEASATPLQKLMIRTLLFIV
jgi:hypothetical protein